MAATSHFLQWNWWGIIFPAQKVQGEQYFIFCELNFLLVAQPKNKKKKILMLVGAIVKVELCGSCLEFYRAQQLNSLLQ